MNKMLLAIAVMCLIAAPGAFAQAQKAPQHERHHAAANGVESRVEHHLKHLSTVLSLSSAQQKQAKAILLNAANQNQPLLYNIRADRRDLRAAVEKDEPTSTIQLASDKLGADVSTLAMTDASAGEQIYKILNPDQRTKLTQLQSHNYGRFGMNWAEGM